VGLSRESDLHSLVFVFRQFLPKHALDVDGLARSRWTNEQRLNVVLDEVFLDVRVSHCVVSGYNYVLD